MHRTSATIIAMKMATNGKNSNKTMASGPMAVPDPPTTDIRLNASRPIHAIAERCNLLKASLRNMGHLHLNRTYGSEMHLANDMFPLTRLKARPPERTGP